MAKGKKSLARDKSPPPTPVSESAKKTPKPRSKSTSRSSSRKKQPQARSKSRSRKGTETKARERSRSRSRSRSKSKSKSPKRKARARSRSRSRSQKTAPAITRARSKSKSKKLETAISELIDIVEQKRPSLVLKNVLHDDYTAAKDSKLNEIIRRSISRELSLEKANTFRVPTHAPVMKNLKEVEPKMSDGMSKDNISSFPIKQKSWKFSVPDFIKAIFGLTIPFLAVLLFHLACNRHQCTISKFHIPKNWKYYWNPKAMGIVVGFVTLQALVSLLPIGKKIGGPPGINGSLQYRCNGLLCTFLTVGVVAGLWRYGYPVTVVYDKLISLLVSSAILGYILGLFLFIKGGRAPVPGLNPNGIIGSRLHQLYVGREINPLIFRKINVKTLLVRTSFNGMLLLNGLLALKAYEAKQELSHALLTCVVLNALLVVDFFWFESSFPLTFQAMYEGTGCALTTSHFLYPFLSALITKYIIQHKIELPVWGSVAIVVGFTIGFVIYRASNLQKAAFRRCPLNPALTQLEAISTNRGKKLLVAGWWGWVRHPNYLGTIILHWAWASASGYTHIIPYVVPLIVTISLMLRAKRVDHFCSQRYQSAWEEYCSRVRYRIFPRVY